MTMLDARKSTDGQRPPVTARSRRNPTVAAAVAAALCTPYWACAQQATSAGLEEVVVTATRRPTTVQDIPYNISAFSGAQIEAAGVTDLSSITRLVPGLQGADLGPRAASTNSSFIIRGLNTNNPADAFVAPNITVPLVSTYIDDVPLFTNLQFTDIERIEVLRGPQGTLYGSGSVGGTVRVIHNPPRMDKTEFEISTRGERTDHSGGTSYGLDTVINVPLGARLAWRLSATYDRQAGFIDATRAVQYDQNRQPILADPANPLTSGYTTGSISDVNSSNSWSVRNTLLWKASDGVSAELAYHHQRDRADSFAAQTPGAPRYTVETPNPVQPIDRKVDMASLTVTADAGFATLTSSSSWYKNAFTDIWDQSAIELSLNNLPGYYGGYPRVTALNFDNSWDRSFAQEFRLVSKTDGAWDWIAGLFYQKQRQYISDPNTIPGFAAWSGLPGSSAAAAAYFGVPDTFGTFGNFISRYRGGTDPAALSPRDLFYNFFRTADFRETAVYGELTYKVTPRWQFTGGARVFWQDFAQDVLNVLPICGSACAQDGADPLGQNHGYAERSFHNQIFKFNTSYKFTPDTTGYLTIAQGYRHGGANALCATPNGTLYCYSDAAAAPLIPYKSDTAVNYELGLKGFALDRRLRYAVGAFAIDWQDIQLETFSPVTATTLILNGRTARSEGFEAELTAQLTDQLSFTFGYAYNDAKLTADFIESGFVGLKGDRLPSVAKNTASLAVDYAQALGRQMHIRYHADAAVRSNETTRLNNCAGSSKGNVQCPPPVQPNQRVIDYAVLGGFTTLSASVALELDPRWELRAYGQNLTNAVGVTAQFAAMPPAYNRDNYQFVTRPRTIGLEARYRFN